MRRVDGLVEGRAVVRVSPLPLQAVPPLLFAAALDPATTTDIGQAPEAPASLDPDGLELRRVHPPSTTYAFQLRQLMKADVLKTMEFQGRMACGVWLQWEDIHKITTPHDLEGPQDA